MAFKKKVIQMNLGFPDGARGKEVTCQCRRQKRLGFHPCVRKIPWRGAWHPTPVFLSRKSDGRRSLVGYSPWDGNGPDTIEACMHTLTNELIKEKQTHRLRELSYGCWGEG